MQMLRVSILNRKGEFLAAGQVHACTNAGPNLDLLLTSGFDILLEMFDPDTDPIPEKHREAFLDFVATAYQEHVKMVEAEQFK